MLEINIWGVVVGVGVAVFIFFCLHRGIAMVMPTEDGSEPGRRRKFFGITIAVGQVAAAGAALWFARRANLGDVGLGLGVVGGLLLLALLIWLKDEKKAN